MHSYKSKFSLAVGIALALSLAWPLAAGDLAFADKTIKKIEKKNREAMENFDLLEYEEAKKLLNQAIVMAKKTGKSKSSAVAKVHLNLGIVYFSGFQDVESAKLEFINAVEIDAKVELDPAYKTAEMEKILSEARKEFGGSRGDDDDGDDDDADIDCESLMGIQHTLVDTAEGGANKDVTAYVADGLKASRITLHYRPEGVSDFIEGKMKKSGGCTYTAAIPGESIGGEFLHYYVAAYNKGGKVIASKGSAGSPNIIEITGATSGRGRSGDNENPLGNGGGRGNGGDDNGSITRTGPSIPGTSKMFISVGVGSGGGYVSGETERRGNEIGCCLAPAYLHLFPEIGYYLSPGQSVSVAFRLGFPIGANIEGHSTAAPAGFLRYRHSLDPSGDGLQVSVTAGGGWILHTVTLTDADDPDQDTDISSTGPLFLGGGAGYTHAMGGPIKFVAELNLVAGLPVVEEVGAIKPNFALHFDANVALLFAF